jgi:hypothetical protein
LRNLLSRIEIPNPDVNGFAPIQQLQLIVDAQFTDNLDDVLKPELLNSFAQVGISSVSVHAEDGTAILTSRISSSACFK